jgi:hypothetical protein
MAEYRELLRVLQASSQRWDDPAVWRASRLLLKVPEHTWGVDIKHFLPDWTRWNNSDLEAALAAGAPDFLATVATGRGRTVEQVREVADGRMFTPAEAQAAGLIDGIATLEGTLATLRQRVGRTGMSASTAEAYLQL